MSLTREDIENKLVEELQKRGLIVKKRALLKGLSGIEHKFDIIVENPEKNKRAAITVLERVDYDHVIQILATRIDVNTPHIVIAKNVRSEIVDLLKSANITVIVQGGLSVAISTQEKQEKDNISTILEQILKLLT